jgi:hypothetical protein
VRGIDKDPFETDGFQRSIRIATSLFHTFVIPRLRLYQIARLPITSFSPSSLSPHKTSAVMMGQKIQDSPSAYPSRDICLIFVTVLTFCLQQLFGKFSSIWRDGTGSFSSISARHTVTKNSHDPSRIKMKIYPHRIYVPDITAEYNRLMHRKLSRMRTAPFDLDMKFVLSRNIQQSSTRD